jgi:rod shape-determining protein MreC
MNAPTRGQRRAVLLLLLLSVLLITLDHRGDAFRGARSAAHSVVDPAQHGVTTLVAPVGRFAGRLGDVGDSGKTIDALRKENADLRRQLREGELSTTRGAELAKLQLLSGRGGFTVMPATVTGLGPSIGFEWTVTVDAGRRDGITVDQTVIDSDGLVGRVKEVGDTSSVVILAVDPGSAVGVRVVGGNALGVAAGNGLGPLAYSPLDPATRLKVGDRLVTGPYGGSTYVAGLPVGQVSAVSGDPGAPAREATITPYVSFARLDLVGIVLAAPRQDPRDKLIPTPPPTAAPSSTPSPPATGVGGSPAGTAAGPPSNSPQPERTP